MTVFVQIRTIQLICVSVSASRRHHAKALGPIFFEKIMYLAFVVAPRLSTGGYIIWSNYTVVVYRPQLVCSQRPHRIIGASGRAIFSLSPWKRPPAVCPAVLFRVVYLQCKSGEGRCPKFRIQIDYSLTRPVDEEVLDWNKSIRLIFSVLGIC